MPKRGNETAHVRKEEYDVDAPSEEQGTWTPASAAELSTRKIRRVTDRQEFPSPAPAPADSVLHSVNLLGAPSAPSVNRFPVLQADASAVRVGAPADENLPTIDFLNQRLKDLESDFLKQFQRAPQNVSKLPLIKRYRQYQNLIREKIRAVEAINRGEPLDAPPPVPVAIPPPVAAPAPVVSPAPSAPSPPAAALAPTASPTAASAPHFEEGTGPAEDEGYQKLEFYDKATLNVYKDKWIKVFSGRLELQKEIATGKYRMIMRSNTVTFVSMLIQGNFQYDEAVRQNGTPSPRISFTGQNIKDDRGYPYMIRAGEVTKDLHAKLQEYSRKSTN